MIGRTIADRFRVVGLIARGGMGKVYRAEQAPLGRMVAVKVLDRNDAERDPDFARRFFLEASACAKLRHPHTVTVFDYGQIEGDTYYIAMELLEGRTVRTALDEDGPFRPDRTIHVASQICRSLREAHGQGVIHRDLKPGNVFLVEHDGDPDFVKVLDFGLVKFVGGEEDTEVTHAGTFMGSPKYAAPEQIRNVDVGPRADVYGLGVLMFEMLTGRVPFDGSGTVEVLLGHVQAPVPPMSEASGGVQIPASLESVVRRCLEKAPADRYASMDALLDALQEVAAREGLALRGGSTANAPLPPEVTVALDDEPDLDVGAFPSPLKRVAPWIGAGLLAVVAAGAYLLLRSPAPETPTPPQAAAAVAPAERPSAPAAEGAAAPAAVPAAPAPRTLAVHLASDPEGAKVRVGDEEICASTPCDLEWTGEDAAKGRVVTFRFERAGNRSLEVMRTVADGPLDVSASLDPVEQPKPQRRVRRPARSPVAPARAAPEPAAAEPDGLDGYKDNPY